METFRLLWAYAQFNSTECIDFNKATLEKRNPIVPIFQETHCSYPKATLLPKNENEATIPLKLRQNMPTRWNSSLHLTSRSLELQAA